MNDILKQLKVLKLDKKTIILIVCGVVALVLVTIGEFTSYKENEKVDVSDTSVYSYQYIKNAQKDLQKILCKINGAGEVSVLITLESCYENVYAKACEQENQSNDVTQKNNFKEEYAIVKKGSSNEECLLIKVYEPKIKGVAVVCEGGDKQAVQQAVTETVCALYDITTDKVSVSKMN